MFLISFRKYFDNDMEPVLALDGIIHALTFCIWRSFEKSSFIELISLIGIVLQAEKLYDIVRKLIILFCCTVVYDNVSYHFNPVACGPFWK